MGANDLPPGFTATLEKADPASGLPLEIRCEKDGTTLALIPSGEFWMGSPNGEGGQDEHPRHKVRLKAYYMAKNEITVAQYRAFCKDTGRKMWEQPEWSADSHPIVRVDWNDAKAYCDWAGCRLPTEAEWENAARAGAETIYHCGDDAGALAEYAWFDQNSEAHTHPVGQKKPNSYGLYDMVGNVSEWVQDWYHDSYRGAPADGSARESPTGVGRVVRSGTCNSNAAILRPAVRGVGEPGLRDRILGMRVALSF